nr:ribosomal protein L4/L1e [uncultured archaeon]
MKAGVFNVDGKKTKEIELPKFFSEGIREDIVARVLEAKKIKQPYAPSPMAGNQSSASGILSHRRHVWKSDRGKGLSRIPRKIFSRRGSQFNWEGATAPSTRGGRRAHPPKILKMLTRKKINKNEMSIALKSAIIATANPEKVSKKYFTLKDEKIKNLPFVVESKTLGLKTKDFIKLLKNIFEENLFDLALKHKEVRSGKGKSRGRKYKQNAGMLLVIGNNEKTNLNITDIAKTGNLGVNDLANGGLGRLTIYTEEAIKELNERFKI